MSTTTTQLQWHEGEQKMHLLTKVPEYENPTSSYLSPRVAHMLQTAPLLALGTVDEKGRPWSTVIGGESGLAHVLGGSVVGIRAIVSQTDPVIEILTKKEEAKGNGKPGPGKEKGKGKGKMVSGLTVDLETRRRIKLYGRMLAHDLTPMDGLDPDKPRELAGMAQLVVNMEQVLGNCPKYLNCRKIRPALPEPKILSDSIYLPQQAISLIAKTDAIFISSADRQNDMDTNIRGGPPGFVRVETNDEEKSTILVWPEYSGNNLYQTLGNLQVSHRAGLIFPDFETGDALYVTGETEVLIGKEAAAVLPHSKLAVRLTLTGARFVEHGLGFRGDLLEASPYNPKVLYLASERAPATTQTGDSSVTATLLAKDVITPTINRYRFKMSKPDIVGSWKSGQHVAISFKDELDVGYSHMRDDDPTSLNDDFLRTFTVSSHPSDTGRDSGEFAITVRSVGRATRFLSQQRPGLEIPILGFGGDFSIQQPPKGDTVFIAGGIGITPLLPQLRDLDISRLHLIWSLHISDLGLVRDTFNSYPALAASTSLFVSGQLSDLRDGEDVKRREVDQMGAVVRYRRLEAGDLTFVDAQAWYLCTGTALRTAVLNWLGDWTVHYEDFSY